jgi:hypothetical protein
LELVRASVPETGLGSGDAVGVDDAGAVGFAEGVGCGVNVDDLPAQPAKRPTIAQRKRKRMRSRLGTFLA